MLMVSGQIITTSAEVTPNGGLVRESPQNPLNSGLGIILICPDGLYLLFVVKLTCSTSNSWQTCGVVEYHRMFNSLPSPTFQPLDCPG